MLQVRKQIRKTNWHRIYNKRQKKKDGKQICFNILIKHIMICMCKL